MKVSLVRRLVKFLCLLALFGGGLVACQRKDDAVAAPSPAATPAKGPVSTVPGATGPAASVTGTPLVISSISPALVGQAPESFTRYLHYPRDPEASKMDDAVQFFCEVTETGEVESTHALVGKNSAFRDAVQNALDWGHFTPAKLNGKAVRSYLGGTVLFLHQNGEPVIVVSLATFDRNRVGKLENYIQPQLIGGLRHLLEKVISSLTKGVLVAGRAEGIGKVGEKGNVTGMSDVSETPKGSGLGDLLQSAVKQGQFTPAYDNGKPIAGGVNIVADFTQF